MMILITYDVETVTPAGARRLRRIAKAFEDYGQRVQQSVFECLLDPAQFTLLRAKLLGLMDPQTDSLRFYQLGANWRGRVEHIGAKPAYDPEGPLLV